MQREKMMNKNFKPDNFFLKHEHDNLLGRTFTFLSIILTSFSKNFSRSVMALDLYVYGIVQLSESAYHGSATYSSTCPGRAIHISPGLVHMCTSHCTHVYITLQLGLGSV